MSAPPVVRIEDRLRGNLQLAMYEGGLYFEKQSSGWKTLRRMAKLLYEYNIAYAEVDGFALFHHGYRQYTESVDLLVTPEGFDAIKQNHRGFVQYEQEKRRFIDLETGVSVRFVLAGEPPGGIAWKGVRFPDPETVAELDDGIRLVNLPTLVSIKLAAWLGNECRIRDLADIQELVKTVCLTKSLTEQLHVDVRDAYWRICDSIDTHAGNFLKLWPLSRSVPAPSTIAELMILDSDRAHSLDPMRTDGVEIYSERPYYDGHAVLVTRDRVVARKYDMPHESEYLFND